MRKVFYLAAMLLFATACNQNKSKFDASGSFETSEVIISSEVTGRIENFNVEEGARFAKNAVVGIIDATTTVLQKEQLQASLAALNQKTTDAGPQLRLLENQLSVQQSQLDNLLHEQDRLRNLIHADAATGKQLDDLNAQVDVLLKQMSVKRQEIDVQKNSISTQNRSILSEATPLKKRIAQVDDQIRRASIVNPVNGTVLVKYAEAGELTAAGKPLYKIADLSNMTLRAYISGVHLSKIALGQPVRVFVDNGLNTYKTYDGVVSWISDKAEFTPKTIQTKEERATLVYATKIKVKNDGFLKIGMHGELQLN